MLFGVSTRPLVSFAALPEGGKRKGEAWVGSTACVFGCFLIVWNGVLLVYRED